MFDCQAEAGDGTGRQRTRCPYSCPVLVARTRAGDRGAVDTLCRAFRRPVSAIVRKWLPRREDREDCVQEILLRMLVRLPTWQGRAPFCHWVNIIARRRAIDWLRRKTRTVQLEHGWLVPDRVTPPWESKEDLKETIRRLREALTFFRPEIRPKVRRAYTLRRRGMDWDEIADRLGVSVSTVHNWMRQLRERLGPPHEW